MIVTKAMRREIERAIDEAVNPTGMSTHSGKARIDAVILQRLLAMADHADVLRKELREIEQNAIINTWR